MLFSNDTLLAALYLPIVSFHEVLLELPGLTLEERHLLIRRALELDDLPLSDSDEAVVESRLAALHDSPESAVSLEDMKIRLRSRHK